MSWHCLYCGKSEGCNGMITLYDIRGGVPRTLCCHISCFAESLETFENTEDIREEIKQWDEELEGVHD